MRVALIFSFFGTLACAQTELSTEVMSLSHIKQKMRENLSHLPNYTCVETIVRGERANVTSLFRPVDSVRVQVLHAGDKELYAWPGSKKYEDNLSLLIGTGTTSSGEFALHARSIFLGNAQYKYVGRVPIRGRAALQYDYAIPLMSSGMTLSDGSRSGRVSMTGSFWVDATSLELLRLSVHAGDIPPDLPFASATSVIDYGRVRIGGKDVLLPQSAEMELHLDSGISNRNQIQFSQCRGFGAESEIRFEAAKASESSPAHEVEKFKDFDLPPGLVIPLRLTQPIDSKTAVEGDPIEARVDEDIRRKHEVVIPAGAIARGRIRRMESYDEPRRYFIVGLEFTVIEFDGQRAAFTGTLDRVDPSPDITWFLLSSKASHVEDQFGMSDYSRNETVRTRDLPGVGTFFDNGAHFQLPAGFQMIWRTVDLKKHP